MKKWYKFEFRSSAYGETKYGILCVQNYREAFELFSEKYEFDLNYDKLEITEIKIPNCREVLVLF